MTSRSVSVFLCILVIQLLPVYILSWPATPSLITEPQEKAASRFALDIESCSCKPQSRDCEVAIAGSIFDEIACKDGQHFCCSVAKNKGTNGKTRDEGKQEIRRDEGKQEIRRDEGKQEIRRDEAKQEIRREEGKQDKNRRVGNIEMRGERGPVLEVRGAERRIESIEEELTESSESPKSLSEPKVKIVMPGEKPNTYEASYPPKVEIRCMCKLRDKCPEKNTDYSFGFHCTYDKVRCCESSDSQDSKDKNTNSGRLINVFTNSENEKSRKTCRCLPESQCNASEGEMVRRKDSACPDKLIQCCGEAIAEKKSDDVTTLMEPTDLKNHKLVSPTVTNINGTERGRSTIHQPIPLPVLVIPPNREDSHMEFTTTTMPPPLLPNQYFVPQTNSHSYNRYYFNNPQKPQVPSYYLNPGRPLLPRGGNRYAINQNGRGLAESQQRSSSNFLSNLANLLG